MRYAGRWWRSVVTGVVVVVAVGAVAGCGGPPKFEAGPGKVRISPIPAGHGQVSFPANVTVDGTGLYLFTHGVRQLGGSFQLNVSAIANPVPGAPPADTSVQAWLGKGDSMTVAGLTVTMLEVYGSDSEGDVQVTAATGGSATATVSP